jgi:monofunctional biosynthetic peptidoglycan transglycosylase
MRSIQGGTNRLYAATLFVLVLSSAGNRAVAEERMLYDFSDPQAVEDWRAINDGVMGGVSSGGIFATDEGTVLFAGRVSLENNGGFASVRSRPRRWDLGEHSGIEIRFRGDGRRYKLNLRTDSAFDGVMYRAAFETREGEWQTLRVPFAEFGASFRGRPVPDAPRLDPARVASVGLLISDKQAGPFRLEIGSIAAYSEVRTGR